MTKLSRICDSIVGRIESGALRQGDRLPSEERLAASYRVSVGTVQKALGRLAHSGLISREHGRGTFVSSAILTPAEVRYLRFQDAAGRELPHYIHVRSVKRMRKKGRWAEFLGGEDFVRIERSLNVGGVLDLYSEFWLRESDFVRLEGVDRKVLAKNLRVMLGRQLALPTLRVGQWIRFEPPVPAAVRQLGLDAQAPCFVMEIRGYTLRDQPLYWQRICAGPFSENFVLMR